MAHVTIPTAPSCNCRPVPDCVAIVNSGATAADLTTNLLTIPGLDPIVYSDIIPSGFVLKCSAAAVAQVNTIAVSSFTVGDCCGNTSEYVLKIGANQCEKYVETDYTVEATTDMTMAQVVDAFVAAINADPSAFVTAADTGNTFTITADTAGCAFTVTYTSSNVVSTVTTANVESWGYPADILADGGASASITATDYHSIDIIYRDFEDNPVKGCEACLQVCKKVCRVYFSNNAGGDTWASGLSTIATGAATASKYSSRSGALTSC